MFKNLQIKKTPTQIEPDPVRLTTEWLEKDNQTPILLRQINNLSENMRSRVFRNLIPPELLVRFQIDPVTWKGADGDQHVRLESEPGTDSVRLRAFRHGEQQEEFFHLNISDNAQGSIDIVMLQLINPDGPRFYFSFQREGYPIHLSETNRDLDEEQRAMEAGLAPGQIRDGLGALKITLNQFEAFLATIGHRAYFLEPQSYSAAWLFEKRGFAYVRGHKLMDGIHDEFQPGGRLHKALDSSTPFRQPGAWHSVRGRAWAIHDKILDAIGEKWQDMRMVKQVGLKAGVETFPNAEF